jgi:hypothetical protein
MKLRSRPAAMRQTCGRVKIAQAGNQNASRHDHFSFLITQVSAKII